MNLNMQTPQKQRGWVQFLPMIGQAAGGLMDMFGSHQNWKANEQARNDILGLPGMQGPMNIGGSFGQSADGQFQMDPQMLAMQNMMGQSGMGMMMGGMFNDPSLQNAWAQNDMAGALDQSNQALMQQMGTSAFGGLGDLYGNATGLMNQMNANVMAGPQDISGGLQGQLFNQAAQNLGSFDQTQASELAAMRQAGQPAMDRQFNQMQNRLHSMGMLGSTGGGEQMRGMFEAQNQADLDYQTQSFGRASQRQSMGLQQAQQAAMLQGQGFNQWNQNFQNAMGAGSLASAIEGQQYGQNLQALQQNQSAGMNRMNQAMGLFGTGADLFNQSYGLGLEAGQGALGYGEFGMNAASMPYQLQAQLLGGSGYHAQALGKVGQNIGQGAAGFWGGLGNATSSLFNFFSDERLKTNLRWVGTDGLGNNWYEWDWNAQAKLVGADKQPSWGVIAQEVEKYHPEAVTEGPGGFKQVNYEVLYNG
jgi:hypothetical protein